MTVLGGLQLDICERFSKKLCRFNTDDGIRRAAIAAFTITVFFFMSFNTDDGIRRAAILWRAGRPSSPCPVSIPMTVLGGLQFRIAAEYCAEAFSEFQYR